MAFRINEDFKAIGKLRHALLLLKIHRHAAQYIVKLEYKFDSTNDVHCMYCNKMLEIAFLENLQI